MKSRNALTVFAGWIALVLASNLAAQAPETGIVTGQVYNEATRARLRAATVEVEATNEITSTDANGDFTLVAPVGSQTLVVSYGNLDVLRIRVVVRAGERTSVDAPMSTVLYKLDPVVVEGLREGEAKAIQLQRESMNPKTVVSADAFGSGDSENPAGLLSRLAGISGYDAQDGLLWVRGFTSQSALLTVDGNELVGGGGRRGGNINRDIVIDYTLSMDNVSAVEFIKQNTPDTHADFVAGQINLITKRAFDQPGRRFDITFGTQWVDLDEPNLPSKIKVQPELDTVVMNYSDTYDFKGGKDNLGVLFNFSRRNTQKSYGDMGGRITTNTQNSFTLPATGFDDRIRRAAGARYGYQEGPQWGGALSFDYKLNNQTYVYWKNNFAWNEKQNYHWIAASVYVPNNATGASHFEPGSNSSLARTRAGVGQVFVQSFGGDPRFANYATSGGFERKSLNGTSLLTLDLSYSQKNNWSPNNSYLDFQLNGVTWEMTDQNGYFPKVRQIGGPDWSDPRNYSISLINGQNARSPVARAGAKLDWKKDFQGQPFPWYFKSGLYADDKWGTTRVQTANYSLINPLTSGVGNFLSYTTTIGQGLYGPFPFGARPGGGAANDLVNPANGYVQLTPQLAYNSVVDSLTRSANYEERISAAYAMAGITFGPLKVLGGVRFEESRVETASLRNVTNPSTTFNNSLSREENVARANARFASGWFTTVGKTRDVFPGIHTIYEPWQGWQFRASVNRSVQRPGQNQLIPAISVNEGTQQVSMGNPGLKATMYDNFDIAIQKYFKGTGYIEFAAWRKRTTDSSANFTSTIGSGADNGFNGQFPGWTLTQRQNIAGNFRINGLEFSYVQQYTFLPGWLSGFGGYANYSYTEVPDAIREEMRTKFANFGVSYVKSGLELRVLGNWVGRYHQGTQPWPNTVLRLPAFRLDLKTLYRMNERYTFYLDIQNITSEFADTGQYIPTGQKTLVKYTGIVYSLGMKWSL